MKDARLEKTVLLFLMATWVAFPSLEAGFVPDEETAVRIAEAVWFPIYGKDAIDKQRPLKAQLIGNVWHVSGSLPEGLGGVAEAEISKEDGRILRISHGE